MWKKRANVEQSGANMTAYQREVCSWGMCVRLHLCVLSLLNLYCVWQVLERRGAGHRHSTARRHLNDFYHLVLSFIIQTPSPIYSIPISSFYICLRDRSLWAFFSIRENLNLFLQLDWVSRTGGRAQGKSDWASQKTVCSFHTNNFTQRRTWQSISRVLMPWSPRSPAASREEDHRGSVKLCLLCRLSKNVQWNLCKAATG